jgi:g-D-glutamyl-meso-diaminopimelate peptidase
LSIYSDQSYSHHDLLEGVRQLTGRYSFVSAHVIGESIMGKPIVALRCGSGPRRIHINGSFHANEWITSALLMRFVADLSASYCNNGLIGGQQVDELCKQVTLWTVPMVNPDGVELVQRGASPALHPFHKHLIEWNGGSNDFSGWKANIRGVDLNDQFPAYWEEECKRRGIEGPGPRDFPGPYPLSEPEAHAMAHFTETIGFDAVVALHTQGREIYWNYRDYEKIR